MNIDIIRPIELASGRYWYVLCAVDKCTRWPEVFCLKYISAKSICEALLYIFSRTLIPKYQAKYSKYQGSNCTTALAHKFIKRLETTPCFYVSGYAKSNGLVERLRAVLDGMIQHTLREHAGHWLKNIPFLGA